MDKNSETKLVHEIGNHFRTYGPHNPEERLKASACREHMPLPKNWCSATATFGKASVKPKDLAVAMKDMKTSL